MSSGSCEGSFGSFCDGGLRCLSTSVYCSVVCRCSLLPLLASGATQCLRDQKLRLLWRSCMSVRSLPIAYLGFSCRVPTYFMCTASTGFVKAFFLCIRVPAQQLEHFQAYSDRAHWAHIGCILALWRPFAERNVQAIEAAFVTEHYCFFFSKTW